MNNPIIVNANSFQDAWANVIRGLADNQWELWDIVVHIDNPTTMNLETQNVLTDFSIKNGLIKPNQVSYTIFPFKLARNNRSFDTICEIYNSKYYPMTRKMPHSGWGTYFHRMINYPINKHGVVEYINQLKNILDAIKSSTRIMRAAYTMIIPIPGWENVRPSGAPCLNSIAVRQEPYENSRIISLLAVYRNHDFFERAYGNYYGLAKLLEYIAYDTDSYCGSLTCVSSHSFLSKGTTLIKSELLQIANEIIGV